MRYDALRKYLAARREGGFGWLARYDRDVCGGEIDFGYLCGHRDALLDDVLDLIPTRLLDEAIRVADEIEERSLATGATVARNP